ncbi:MAG: TatD family hydrolase [Candidatus Pacebacteria bacterium]|nr:TatD family hydrolase [Candidatus Paceibacterota bacterium]
MLIDTHAHLNFPQYVTDTDRVIKRSIRNGVGKIVCVGSNLADSRKAIDLAQEYPETIYAAAGIHPHDTASNSDLLSSNRQIKQLKLLAQNKHIIAIGECGLDYSSPPPGEKERSVSEQRKLFQSQIEIAQELNLPLLVHTRKAFAETMDTLEKACQKKKITGVIHFYSAGKKGIKRVLNLGFFFGLDGNLTYEQGLQIVASQIPLEKIILETDCPWLTPEPFRGQRNEPKNIKFIAEALAKIKKVSFEKIAFQTTQNAGRLLRLNN